VKYSLDLRGVTSGVITPFDSNNRIDWYSLANHVDYLASSGLKGILVNAMMAEGLHLNQHERNEILYFVAERIHGRKPLIATIYGLNTEDAIEQVNTAKSVGAKAALVFPHPSFGGAPLDPAVPTEYFTEIGRQTEIPVIVFRTPSASGPTIGLDVMKKLSNAEEVFGLKDSIGEIELYEEQEGSAFLDSNTKLKIFIDQDKHILNFLRKGAYGAMSLCASIAPNAYSYAFEHVKTSEADDVIQRLSHLCEIVFRAPKRDFRARIKEALVHAGIINSSAVRLPLSPIDLDEKREIANMMHSVLDLENSIRERAVIKALV
jgi:dihydrodipicolinate synthase/N-acetylneuraminate lyase